MLACAYKLMCGSARARMQQNVALLLLMPGSYYSQLGNLKLWTALPPTEPVSQLS